LSCSGRRKEFCLALQGAAHVQPIQASLQFVALLYSCDASICNFSGLSKEAFCKENSTDIYQFHVGRRGLNNKNERWQDALLRLKKTEE